jgi:hypothetical protein
MNDLGTPLDAVVLFEVGDEELVRRISGRRTCSLCNKVFNIHTAPPPSPATDCVPDSNEHQLFQRKDDEEATVAERLRVYARQTQPVLSYYSDAGLLRTVRAEGLLADITQRLLDVLTSQAAKPVKPVKRAAKRRTVTKKKAKSRTRAVPRRKAKVAKRRPAARKAPRKVVRKVVRKAKRLARRVRRKSKRR